MPEHLQLDNLDRGILNALLENARTAYAELAKQFNVSPGTIHVSVEKMKQAGVCIVQINGQRPVKENVSRITELLKNIETTRDREAANSKAVSMLNLITQTW